MLIAAGTIAGYVQSHRLSQRVAQLEEMLRFLNAAQTEIRYSAASVVEILQRHGSSLACLQQCLAYCRAGEDFHIAWEEGVRIGAKGTGLTEEDQTLLRDFGSGFGASDVGRAAFSLPPVCGAVPRPVGACAAGKGTQRKALPDAGIVFRHCRRFIPMLNGGISNHSPGSNQGDGEEKKMDVDLIFRIAAIGIIVAVLNQLLVRSGREEQAMMTTLAGLIVVLMMIIQQIDVLFQSIKSIFGL